MSRMATQFFAPASLSLEEGEDEDSPHALSELEPGDIVLLRTPGIVYQGFRQIASYPYDHVVVALSRPDHCLHISPPKARRVKTSQILIEERDPIVLRPQLSPSEKQAFVARCESLLGTDYSLTRLYGTMLKRIAEKQFRIGRFLPKVQAAASTDKSWLCTDGVLVSLMESSSLVKSECLKMKPPLDFSRTGSASIGDILRLRDRNLLYEVPVLLKTSKSTISTAERLKQAWDQAGERKISLRTVGFVLLLSSYFNRRLFFTRMLFLLVMLFAVGSKFYSSIDRLRSKI